MRVCLIGDFEGDAADVAALLTILRRGGCDKAVLLGDVGMRRDGVAAETLVRLERGLADLDQPCYFLDGNHDRVDPDLVADGEPCFDGVGLHLRRADGGRHRYLRFLPRGARWDWAQTRFCVLGGADCTIERWMGADERSFPVWMLPQPADVERAVAGGECDVLLSHDCAVTDSSQLAAVFGITRDHPAAATSRALIRRAVEQTRPLIHVHGHYHQRRSYKLRLADGTDVQAEALDEALTAAGSYLLDTSRLHRASAGATTGHTG